MACHSNAAAVAAAASAAAAVILLTVGYPRRRYVLTWRMNYFG